VTHPERDLGAFCRQLKGTRLSAMTPPIIRVGRENSRSRAARAFSSREEFFQSALDPDYPH
jgi:hypothetical protein